MDINIHTIYNDIVLAIQVGKARKLFWYWQSENILAQLRER